MAMPPSFSTGRISLLDRGWAYAIAHIRGGDDLGYDWFLQGKLEQRTNTFNDFVDAAKGLIAAGFTKAGNIAIEGRSAGGELMGAVANSDPGAVGRGRRRRAVRRRAQHDARRHAAADPGRMARMGQPDHRQGRVRADPQLLAPTTMSSAQAYPPMLITGGLNDPRVTYWEPAKWAARLRATKTDDNLLLLKIDMGAGHGGKSGRWDHLKEIAEAYAFVLTQVGGT